MLEATLIGLVLLVVALYLGRWVSESPALAPMFTLSRANLAWLIMAYGFAASVLPVWLLLAPRDYLSAFVKIGDFVTADSVVCIIEAMKVFNEIKADVSGSIEQILVKNEQPVEFGQPLFLVRPN